MSTVPKASRALFDDVLTAFSRGHIIVIGHRFTAQGLNFVNDLIGRPLRAVPGTVPSTAQIVHHNFGAAPGELQGIGPAQSGAGAGDNSHTPIKANLLLGNLSIFKNAVVDHHFFGFCV